MKYISTRGGSDSLTFEEAVLRGLAPNGGLFIPESIPSLPGNWQSLWSGLSFQELAVEIFSLFIPESEVAKSDLRDLVQRSYCTFRHEEVAPIHQIESQRFVLELFHGPTFAFKDVALQFLGNLFEFFLKRKNARLPPGSAERERLTIVGATSGDTGSAAIYGVRNKEDISIFILHPAGRVSPIQEAQMTTVLDRNVHNLAVGGTFDDCQDAVKALFNDRQFNEKHKLGAVNSINWARILAQITYYFSTYFKILRQNPGSTVQFVVPTGNFGDVLAGYYAKRMGLPMGKLVIATNSNDILARFWKTGVYEKSDSQSSEPLAAETEPVEGASDGKQATSDASGVKETLSPAMDILVSSNFERLLWYLSLESNNGSPVAAGAQVLSWMTDLKEKGVANVGPAALALARRDFEAERASDAQTKSMIKHFYNAGGSHGAYVVDPHTAVGLDVALRMELEGHVVQVMLATAHPAKFASAVDDTLSSQTNFNFNRDVLPKEFEGLLQKERRVVPIAQPNNDLIKAAIVAGLQAEKSK